MKRNTIKWRIFKYNLVVIILLITLVTVIFNIAVRVYFEKDILGQLNKIASRTEDTALRQGPDLFPDSRRMPPPPDAQGSNDLFRFYLMLDRSLREPLTMLNANYILLDTDKNRISMDPDDFLPPWEGGDKRAPLADEFFAPSAELLDKITSEIIDSKNFGQEAYVNFHISGTEHIAIIKPVAEKNSFGLGWIIIYSSIQKVNQLQLGINIILLVILLFSALIIVLFSSLVSKKISSPFSSLNQHIRAIAERNFGTKIQMQVDDELQEFVNNINIMSEKLESYDKAQKTFLQNASHEFRTPLMSIQGYAEGIKHHVVDMGTAADIIIDESKRMTHLVEDLLYLSRLDTIEESYHFGPLQYNDFIHGCMDRMNGIALKHNIRLTARDLHGDLVVNADEEKLSRAVTNILSNCIRYAGSCVDISSEITDKRKVRLVISDDGPGFDANELPNIFERFYKGKKGIFGLGLAISKNVVEKHQGKIAAENSPAGARFIIELPFLPPH